MKQTFKELVKYGLVGIVGVGVDAGIFYLLTKVLDVHYPFSGIISSLYDMLGIRSDIDTSNALVSNIISSFLGAVNNFILNSYFTFKVKDKKLRRFVPYVGLVVFGMIISTVLLTVMLDYLHMDKMVAKICAIFIVAMIQFLLNKFIIFKKKAL